MNIYQRLKYGTYLILFILSIASGLIASVFASVDLTVQNSIDITYKYSTLCSGYNFNTKLKEISTINEIVFDEYNQENLTLIDSAVSTFSVASDNSDSIMAYQIPNGDSYSIYILSNYNIWANADSYGMFQSFTALKTITFNNFITNNVTSMASMFYECSSLTNLDLSGFNTSKVSVMYSMFKYCSSLTSTNLSSFNISKVSDMHDLFYGCTKLAIMDLSGFNTSRVTNMNNMFRNCSRLTTIYVGDNWTVEKVTSSTNMFYLCKALIGGNGTIYNSSIIDVTYAHIDVVDNPGYLTSVEDISNL